ncbi:MAG TPA: M48 family metallopeptidase [Gemmatimonadaceae bacterium]|nr:M48 family metallopeptidase [Gemmatimonadaceae bacterium]
MTSGRPEWTGFYYDGLTARREPVRLTIEAESLQLHRPDGTTLLWPVRELRQTQGRFPGERLRIEFGREPVEAVVVDQPGLAEAIRVASPGASRTLRGHSNTAYAVAGSLLGLIVIAASYVWGAPVMADRLASRVPVAWETNLGRSAVARLAPPDRVCRDPESVAALRAILDRLTAAAPRSPYAFRLSVVRDTSVNAFAAPGGFIVVTSGLLSAARTPDELAGVLAHEIQHVTRRHSTRAIIREMPLRLSLSAVFGGSGFESAAGLVGSLGALRYYRADEVEADVEGMRLLRAADVDPAGMVAFMRTMQTRYKDTPSLVSYFSSHPRTADRVAVLESLAEGARYNTRPLLDAASWQRVVEICGAARPSNAF